VNKETPFRAFGGVVSAAFGLAVGELVSGIFDSRSPIVSVGDRVVDGVPASVKRLAINLFGTSDKVALLIGILAITVLFAAFIGAKSRSSRWISFAGVAMFVVVGSGAAVSGRLGSLSDVVPVFAAGIATLTALNVLLYRVHRADASSESTGSAVASKRASRVKVEKSVGTVSGESSLVVDSTIGGPNTSAQRPDGLAVDRRRFVILGTGTALATAATAVLGRKLHGNAAAAESRSAVSLPTPPTALALPDTAAQVRVPGMTPFFTPNSDFYRIDTALVVPRLDARTWKLKIDGMVDHPLTLTFADLQKREVIEHDCTLMCVSNEIGGNLVGNARWLGVRLADILKEVGVKAGASQIYASSVEGFSAGFPTELALDGREAMLAFGMNGEPLSFSHGFPVRLVVPGIYGYVSAVKWLESITLTTFEDEQGYWIPRGWSTYGPVKTSSRIDVPGRGSGELHAGRMAIAGVAWAQHVGITKVEVQIDDGPWHLAKLAADGGIDTWRQWSMEWNAPVGVHTIRVRATDATGTTQTPERADVAPDGATGWHTIQVNIL
jgi:DMSO/TMAO reductase YedYZ molybdopterin-dependent catalytic subunit